jgi:hypothetical protein
MVIINAFKKLRSALMSLTSAGKNGKNVFISVKILSKILGVLLASALMNLRSALMSLRSALMSLKSAGKNGKNVFISGIGIRGRLETTGSHTSHIFSATQSTRQQDSKLVRVMLCLRGKRKAQNHCLFSTSHF